MSLCGNTGCRTICAADKVVDINHAHQTSLYSTNIPTGSTFFGTTFSIFALHSTKSSNLVEPILGLSHWGPLFIMTKVLDHENCEGPLTSSKGPYCGKFRLNFEGSQVFKCDVETYTTGLSTKCYFTTIIFMWAFLYKKSRQTRVMILWIVTVPWFCVKSTTWGGLSTKSDGLWNKSSHCMPCRTPCRLFLHSNFIGPFSVRWSDLVFAFSTNERF